MTGLNFSEAHELDEKQYAICTAIFKEVVKKTMYDKDKNHKVCLKNSQSPQSKLVPVRKELKNDATGSDM